MHERLLLRDGISTASFRSISWLDSDRYICNLVQEKLQNAV
jgi:hypothetical protein